MTTAVVFGGGGSAGVAWEIGVLTGLAEAGIHLRSADAFIGTSAGSIVTTQLLAGPGIDRLFERAREPVDAPPMDLDFAALSANWAAAHGRRHIGRRCPSPHRAVRPRHRHDAARTAPGRDHAPSCR